MEPNFQTMPNQNDPQMRAPDPALLSRPSKHRGPIVLAMIAVVLGALWFLAYKYSSVGDVKYNDMEKFNLLEESSNAVTKTPAERISELKKLQDNSAPIKQPADASARGLDVLNK